MHLIQRMKIRRELRSLEQRVREEPSPSAFVDLGQVYVNLDMCEKAIRAAEEGLVLFPGSPELEQMLQLARRSQARTRIQALRKKIERSPSPKSYRDLAWLYLETGDFASVQATCEECMVRHPSDPGAWLVMGQARLGNFYRDLSAREGIEAVRCLNQVVKLDPGNKQARRLLAEVCYRVGATADARAHLDVLTSSGVDDSEVGDLARAISAQVPFQGSLEAAFQAAERRGCLASAPPTRRSRLPKGRDGISRIRDSLTQIAESGGVRKAAYIKGWRALVRGEIRDSRDPFLKVSRVVAKASQRFARRLDIGDFYKGILDGPFGRLCLCSYGEVVAAALCAAECDAESVLADLHELVAGSLYSSGAVEP
ncbi:MAG: hypothetical protein Fur0037_29390 [Planctomycetota bacterium]